MKGQEVAQLQTDRLQSAALFGSGLKLWVKMRQKIARDDRTVEEIRRTGGDELDCFGWQFVGKRDHFIS